MLGVEAVLSPDGRPVPAENDLCRAAIDGNLRPAHTAMLLEGDVGVGTLPTKRKKLHPGQESPCATTSVASRVTPASIPVAA